MLLLGLVLMIVAAAVTAGAIYDGGEHATFEVFGQTVGTTVAGIFMIGLATMLVFFIGVWMTFSSAGRARRRRIARKEARNRQHESVSQMEQERAQLRAENERLNERLATNRPAGADGMDNTAGTTTAAGAGTTGPDAAERPTHVTGDRVVDHTTDLPDESATGTTTGDTAGSTDLRASERTTASDSGRHRDL
jgi:ABC-type nickel/cobalt efflux system permease component RcnA